MPICYSYFSLLKVSSKVLKFLSIEIFLESHDEIFVKLNDSFLFNS